MLITSTFKEKKLTSLLIVNASIFILVNLSNHLLGYPLENLLGLPSKLNSAIIKIWTLFTFMFTHQKLGHIFSNLLLLYFLGQAFEVIIGAKRLILVYVLGGIAGALIYLLFSLFFPHLSGDLLIGASASVMAIGVAIGFYAPELPVQMLFFGEIKIKWFVTICFIVSTILDFSVNTGGKISHIGGAIFGMIYAIQLKKGNEFKLNLTKLFKPKKSKLKIAYKKMNSSALGALTEMEKQKILDGILEKIHRSGYDSLSNKEKEVLHELSKN